MKILWGTSCEQSVTLRWNITLRGEGGVLQRLLLARGGPGTFCVGGGLWLGHRTAPVTAAFLSQLGGFRKTQNMIYVAGLDLFSSSSLPPLPLEAGESRWGAVNPWGSVRPRAVWAPATAEAGARFWLIRSTVRAAATRQTGSIRVHYRPTTCV